MIQRLNNQLEKCVTALAVMLIAMLVVQAPVAMVDRALHASGQVHSADAFAGPLAADLADHDHQVAQDQDRDASPSQDAHHHHDGPSVFGLASAMSIATPWVASTALWPDAESSLISAEPSPQKRPPKALLEHVA